MTLFHLHAASFSSTTSTWIQFNHYLQQVFSVPTPQPTLSKSFLFLPRQPLDCHKPPCALRAWRVKMRSIACWAPANEELESILSIQSLHVDYVFGWPWFIDDWWINILSDSMQVWKYHLYMTGDMIHVSEPYTHYSKANKTFRMYWLSLDESVFLNLSPNWGAKGKQITTCSHSCGLFLRPPSPLWKRGHLTPYAFTPTNI